MRIPSLVHCLLGTVVLCNLPLQAGPLKEPKRVVEGRTADLSPLFRWWAKRQGMRPLAAWVEVSGSIVGTNSLGWVVEAQIESTSQTRTSGSAGSAKIVLRDPPMQERAAFEELHRQYQLLEAERGKIAAQQDQAHKAAQRVALEKKASGRRSRTLRAESRQDKAVETQAKEALKPIDQKLEELKKQLAAFPNPDHYAVDCFALETGQQFQGLKVFDHGLGSK